MRSLFIAASAFALCGCHDSETGGVNERAMPTAVGAKANAVGGVPAANAPGLGARPLSGSGTQNLLAMWTGETVLGNAPAKIDASGNLILRPGTAIIVISADGTKCWHIAGEAFTKLTPNCPTF